MLPLPLPVLSFSPVSLSLSITVLMCCQQMQHCEKLPENDACCHTKLFHYYGINLREGLCVECNSFEQMAARSMLPALIHVPPSLLLEN